MTRPLLVLLLALPALAYASLVLDELATGDQWIVYFAADFDKNPLCAVLSCRKHEACLVKDNNALCVKKHKLHEIHGVKIHHDSGKEVENSRGPAEKVGKESAASNEERYKEKLAHHKERISQKHHSQHKNDKMNQVHYQDDTRTFKHKEDNKHKHEHNSRHQQPRADCDEKELRSMGGRLLQWFSDVHSKAEINENLPLPSKYFLCTAWILFRRQATVE
uniref:Secreted protein n=1 Tax=Plectus sambesii TaxID=2011161 RepID=A0A914W4U3_9BILA